MKIPMVFDIGLIEKFEAIYIVSTNSLQTAINFHKANTICKTNHSPELIICAALDSANNEILYHPHNVQSY